MQAALPPLATVERTLSSSRQTSRGNALFPHYKCVDLPAMAGTSPNVGMRKVRPWKQHPPRPRGHSIRWGDFEADVATRLPEMPRPSCWPCATLPTIGVAPSNAQRARIESAYRQQLAENRVRELRGGPYEQPKCSDDHPSMVEALARLASANEQLARISEQQDARTHRWNAVNGPRKAAEKYLSSLGAVLILEFTGESAKPPKGGNCN